MPADQQVLQSPDAEISLLEIWAALYSRKFLIAFVSLLGAILAAGGSYLVRPVFRAEVLVAPVVEQKNGLGALAAQFGGLAELAGVSLGGGGNRAAAIATLKSRSLTEGFINERKLLPILFDNAWDAAGNRWKSDDPKKTPTLWDAFQLFDKSIRSLDDDRKTGLISLAIEWRDPKAAADWANELVRRANARLQQEAIEEGQKTIEYLQDQLTKATAIEVRQALYSLIEVETKNIAVAHSREEFAFKVLDPAVEPQRKIKPNRAMITILGFLMGGLASSLFALITRSR